MVQFWFPGSKVAYYEGSQLQTFATQEIDDWGLWGTPVSNMEREGIMTNVQDLPNGG